MNMIRPLKENEFNQAIAFANQVFFPSLDNDFLLIQPKIYKHPDQYYRYHFVDEIDGNIAGMVGCYPMTYRGVKFLGIGTVCVDEKYRNHGIMQKMFSYINHQMSSEYSVMYLQGDKNRYEHFGFYKTGQKITFRIKKRNFENIKYRSITIKPYLESDSAINHQLFQIYSSVGNINREADSFYDILKTASYEIFIVTDSDILGYLVYDRKNKVIREITVNKPVTIDVLYQFIAISDYKEVFYEVSIDDENLPSLFDLSENYQISILANLKIIDYAKTIELLLRNKKQLKKGVLTIKITDVTNLQIEVNDEVLVKTIANDSNFDLVLSEKEAHTLFFTYQHILVDKITTSDLVWNYFPLALPCTICSIDSI